MAASYKTIQTNAISSSVNESILNYGLFLTGNVTTRDILKIMDPQKTGRARLFMVRKPLFLQETMPKKLNAFKHILEYGFTSISGIENTQVDFTKISYGNNGKGFEIPTTARNDTSSITIKVIESKGGFMREVIHAWINGAVDLEQGYSTYNGADIERLQANQTAEFIYTMPDVTGLEPEVAYYLTNIFPKEMNDSAYNYNSGDVDVVQTEIPFTCTLLMNINANELASALLKRYRIVVNSLNLSCGIKASELSSVLGDSAVGINAETGMLDTSNANVDNGSLKI